MYTCYVLKTHTGTNIIYSMAYFMYIGKLLEQKIAAQSNQEQGVIWGILCSMYIGRLEQKIAAQSNQEQGGIWGIL